jgi:hypothetical protein
MINNLPYMKILQPTQLLLVVLSVVSPAFSQEILVNRIQIACGKNYFSEDEQFNNPALLVRGLFCGDSYYFWTPVGQGDTLSQLAYLDGEPFSGKCIDLDSNGILLGKYMFKAGFIQQLEEFYESGEVYKRLHFQAGIPHGSALYFAKDGSLKDYFNFENGQRSGAYYLTRDRTDWGLPPCIEFGNYIAGEAFTITKPCFSEGD